MTDFDPKSVIVKRKSPSEDTSNVPLIDCPKCGFWTPVDPYCASCGVEMATIKRKTKAAPLNPALLAGGLGLLVIAAFIFLRAEPTPVQNENLTTTLSSEKVNGAGNTFMKTVGQLTGTSPEATELREDIEDSQSNAEAAPSGANLGTPPTASASLAADTEATSSAANALVTETETGGAKIKPEVLVAFLWVEVSKEWLQAMSAADPGAHSIPDLETRLRETQGAYNIISATRHRVGEKTEPIDIAGPERYALRFDLTAAPETVPGSKSFASSLSGVVQTAARQNADGSVRAASTAPITIGKEEGTIFNLGKISGRVAGSASTASEIVVLILPRWVDDRNP